MSREDRLVIAACAAVLVLVHVVSIASLGQSGLIDPDEPRYAGAARDMLASGDYLIPRFNDEVRIVKPILAYWPIVASLGLLGESEFAVRLPSALAGLATSLLTLFIGSMLYGQRTGWLAAALLTCSPLPLIVSRLSTPDAMLGMTMCASVAIFVRAYGAIETASIGDEAGPESGGRRDGWLLAIVLAVGFLIKGPVAAIVPLLVVAVFLGMRRDLRFLGTLRPLSSTLIFLALALPWFIAVAMRPEVGGPAVFYRETIGRFVGTEAFHPEPLWYFVPVALAGFFPWSLAAFAGTHESIRATARLGRFPLVWAAVVLVFFSLSANKLVSYLAPMGPAVALLGARGIELALRRRTRARSLLERLEAVLFLVAAVVGVVFLQRQYPHTVAAFVPAGVLFLVLGAVGLAGASNRVRALPGRLTRVVLFGCVLAYSLVVFAPMVADERSYVHLESVLAPRIETEDLLIEGWFSQPGLVYYSRHPVLRLDSDDDIAANMNSDRMVYCFLDREDFDRVSRLLERPAEVLFEGRGRVLACNRRGRATVAVARPDRTERLRVVDKNR